MIKPFTIIVFTENNAGLIVRLVTMISRRRIHIDNLHVESYAREGMYRFVLLIKETKETVAKLMLQIDKQVEVFKSFYDSDEEGLMKAQALFFQKDPEMSKPEILHRIPEENII